MNSIDLFLLPVLARACLVILFPLSAYDKIAHWKEALEQANSSWLPGGPVLLILGILVELLAPICIVLGWHDRLAAFMLAGFCAVTALLYHPFWKYPDFWSANGEGRAHFWDFFKNFGLVGGLLLLMIGGLPLTTTQVVAHPLSSAPYTASPAAIPAVNPAANLTTPSPTSPTPPRP
jgi:putative oxidoreductase